MQHPPAKRQVRKAALAALALVLASLACNASTPTAEPTSAPGPAETVAPTSLPATTDTPAPANTSSPTSTSSPTDTPTSTPTPSPTNTPRPTATPAPPTPNPAEFRGLVPNAYSVQGAPGPFAVNQEIWFYLDITNPTGGAIAYNALGAWVEETGQFQQSWTYSSINAGQRFTWSDHLQISTSGTYRLWLVIQFPDGAGVKLMGPVVITVQ